MEEILQKDALDQYKYDMVRYSMETNRRRAFPDYKDGFKLCHRRILYVMGFELACKTKLVKSAQVTGKVIGEYHPHGDASVYTAIVPLANWYSTYLPLVYSESNMGSMQGDSAAAQRYTEVMLSEFAKEAIFKEMSETPDIVDWIPTYSGEKMEPEYLPVSVPLLLINGTWGIGVGESTSIPPHNINEVIDATLRLIDNPNAPVVLVPDQCMPCDIIEADWKQISNSGSGSFKVRGRVDIEVFDKGKPNEHYVLVVKSVPDSVCIDNGKDTGISYQINNLIDSGKLPQVTGLFEDSHGTDMRFLIHLKKGADPYYVRDFLYKSTQLQDSKAVNFRILDGINLIRMSYKSYLEAFIMQRKITKFRYYCIKLQNVRTQLHEKEICIMVIKSGKINDIIKKIQTSKSKNDVELINWLVKLLGITDLQAKFILNYPLKKLTPVYLKEYEKAAAEYREIEKRCVQYILNEDLILQEIKSELLYFKQKYGFPRKSRVISAADVANIPQGTFNVVVTENNFIRKLPENEPIGACKGDNPISVVKIDNTSDVILITAQGRMFRFPVYKIPITEKNSSGIDIRILIKGISSAIVAMFDVKDIEKLDGLRRKYYAVIVTRNNCIKKLDLSDILIATQGGIIMTKLNPQDLVQDVKIVPNDIDIIIYSDRKALRCKMADIPNYKRNTVGVAAMKTDGVIDGISAIDPSDTDIVVLTDSGSVNKFSISGMSLGKRYQAGNSVIKLGKTEKIYAMYGVKDSYAIHVLTKNAKYDIPVSTIPRLSSISSGTKMIPMKGDLIVTASLTF
jgi:DNA gyrase subunit A